MKAILITTFGEKKARMKKFFITAFLESHKEEEGGFTSLKRLLFLIRCPLDIEAFRLDFPCSFSASGWCLYFVFVEHSIA